MMVALGKATIPVMQQENVRICNQYREHEECTHKVHLPLHGQVTCTSQPCCDNPVFPRWGHSAPLSTFFQVPHYLSSALEGISQEQRHRDSRTGHLIVPQVPAEATRDLCEAGRAAPFLLLLRHAAILAKPTSQRKGNGLIATRAVGGLPQVRQHRLLLLEPEVLISRLQRYACMIYLEVAFLSADVDSVQRDCPMKQPQEWILFASVPKGECKIFTSQESKTPSCLTNINQLTLYPFGVGLIGQHFPNASTPFRVSHGLLNHLDALENISRYPPAELKPVGRGQPARLSRSQEEHLSNQSASPSLSRPIKITDQHRKPHCEAADGANFKNNYCTHKEAVLRERPAQVRRYVQCLTEQTQEKMWMPYVLQNRLKSTYTF